MHFLAALFLFAMCVCMCVCSLVLPTPTPAPQPLSPSMRSSILYAAAFCCSCCCCSCTYENEKLSDRRPNGANNTEHTPNTHTHTQHTHTHTYLHKYCHWQLVERALRGRTRVKGQQCQQGVWRGSYVRLSRLWLRFYVITLRLRDV